MVHLTQWHSRHYNETRGQCQIFFVETHIFQVRQAVLLYGGFPSYDTTA